MGKICKSKIIILLLLPFVFFGQEQNGNDDYEWFDQVLGHEHLAIHYGTQYIDKDVGKVYKGEHSFFKSSKSLQGTIHYDGQTYYDLGMKYNLETDRLLLALQGTSLSVLQLVTDKLENFTIDNTKFVRVDRIIDENTRINGFYELLLEKPSFQLLKKHKAKRISKIGNVNGTDKLLTRFGKKSWYVLNSKEQYSDLRSKSDIIKIYPLLKKEIKLFYREYQILRKKQPDSFMKKLFDTIIQPSLQL